MFPFGKLNERSKPNPSALKGGFLALGLTVAALSLTPQQAQAFDMGDLKGIIPTSVPSSYDVKVSGDRVRWDVGDFKGSVDLGEEAPEFKFRVGKVRATFEKDGNAFRVGRHRIPAPSLNAFENDPEGVAHWQREATEHFGLNAEEKQSLKVASAFASHMRRDLTRLNVLPQQDVTQGGPER